MRSLFDILKTFEKSETMEYCSLFNAVKSILETVNRLNPFSKLVFRSGNDYIIQELVSRFNELMKRENLVDSNGEFVQESHIQLRKINMLLILNVDATYKYDIKKDLNLVHVIELCPPIPKFVYVELMWELNMDQFIFELLSYAPIWFTQQHFEAAVDALNFVKDPYKILLRIECILRSLCISISRTDLYEPNNVEKKIIYKKLSDSAMYVLRQFFTPDIKKLEALNKNERSKYAGYVLKHILQTLLFMINIYENPDFGIPLIDTTLYEICGNLCKNPNGKLVTADDFQLSIISATQNALQNNLMLLKIETFVYWAEVDFVPGRSLQKEITELAWIIKERTSSNTKYEHDVKEQLGCIAIKPKTLSEIAAEAPLRSVLQTLDEPLEANEKKIWLDELLSRKIALSSDECLETIEANIKYVTVKNCMQIMDFIKLHTSSDDDNELELEVVENLFNIFHKVLETLSEDDLLQLIEHKKTVFGDKCHLFMAKNYNERMTEFFNKNLEDFDIKKFCIFWLEDTETIWKQFFNCASQNPYYIEHFCSVAGKFRSATEGYVIQLLNKSFSDRARTEQRYFPEFISAIYIQSFDRNEYMDFFQNFAYKTIEQFIELEGYAQLLTMMKIFNSIAKHWEKSPNKEAGYNKATIPVLATVAKLMDFTRWDANTYTDLKDQLLNECTQFVKRTVKRLLPVVCIKARQWLLKSIDHRHQITKYYFHKFNLKPEQNALNFDDYLRPEGFQNEEEIIKFLLLTFHRCIRKECEWLSRSVKLRPYIPKYLQLFARVVSRNSDNVNTVNNLRHCLSNYAHIININFKSAVEQDMEKSKQLVNDILQILKLLPTVIYNETLMNFEPILIEIIEKIANKYDAEYIKFIIDNIAETMPKCDAREILILKIEEIIVHQSDGV